MRCISLAFLAALSCVYGFDAKAAASDDAPAAIYEALSAAVHENYPMLEMIGWRDEWDAEFRGKVAAAATREEAMGLMNEYVCRLNDYHSKFFWPGKPQTNDVAARIEPVLATELPPDYGIWGKPRPPVELPALEGVAIAVTDAPAEGELRAGDEIVGVDGVPARDVLAKAWKNSVGSSVAGKLRSACTRMLAGAPGSGVQLNIRRAGKIVEFSVTRRPRNAEATIAAGEAEGVPVIRIARWSNREGEDLVAAFDAALEKLRESPGLIIDVRRNGGGQDDLADKIIGRFIEKPVLTSISFRPVEADGKKFFEKRILMSQPRGPWRYEGRVAVLTDEGCMSSCEHFVSGMAEAGALLCGTPTSGACGLIRQVSLPGGARLNISRTLPIHTGGIPSPMLGIAPHIWAPRRLADLREGKDTALAAAAEWIKSRDPLPGRMQPMTPFSFPHDKF